MRVLIVSNLYPPTVLGGYELACAKVADGLRARGHAIRVLTSWSHLAPPAPRDPDVSHRLDLAWHVAHMPHEPGARRWVAHAAMCSSFGNTAALLEEIREFRPDVVYVWNLIGIGGMALVDLLNMAGVAWVYHLMDRVPADLVTNVDRAAAAVFGTGLAPYRGADVVAMSRHLIDEIENIVGERFAGPVDIVPGWVETGDVRPHAPYLRDGRARFVAAGTVAAFKGTDLILEAAATLKAEGLAFEVDIYGSGDVSTYVSRAQALQVDDRVRFLGPRRQRELLELYAGYDAFLFPTHEREPFGFAPVEAAGCGTPPIMTAACGAAERLVDGVHCIKIPRRLDDLAHAMRRVIAGEVDLPRLGRAGRRLVARDLSFERGLDMIERILYRRHQGRQADRIDDPSLNALAFLKHNLAARLVAG